MVRSERESDRWWNDEFSGSDDPVVSATALLVLGAGLGSLFGVPILSAVDFWVIFIIGYAVILPLVSLLRGNRARSAAADRSASDRQHAAEERSTEASETDDDVDAALERLRDRYARGDLSDEQFEQKLEVLLDTDTPEDARDRLERKREAASESGNLSRSTDEPERERSE